MSCGSATSFKERIYIQSSLYDKCIYCHNPPGDERLIAKRVFTLTITVLNNVAFATGHGETRCYGAQCYPQIWALRVAFVRRMIRG